MHRSSESIAALASALAKAQTILVNPEKTMTATVRDDRRGEGTQRNFRYATLASGLELVQADAGYQPNWPTYKNNSAALVAAE